MIRPKLIKPSFSYTIRRRREGSFHLQYPLQCPVVLMRTERNTYSKVTIFGEDKDSVVRNKKLRRGYSLTRLNEEILMRELTLCRQDDP